MIIQHLLLFVFLAFLLGRKPKPNYRTRSRNYDAAFRRPAERMLRQDTMSLDTDQRRFLIQAQK